MAGFTFAASTDTRTSDKVAASLRELTFPTLTTGSHTAQVVACNSDGEGSASPPRRRAVQCR